MLLRRENCDVERFGIWLCSRLLCFVIQPLSHDRDIPADRLSTVELDRMNDEVYKATTGLVRAITSMARSIQQDAVTEQYVDLVKVCSIDLVESC